VEKIYSIENLKYEDGDTDDQIEVINGEEMLPPVHPGMMLLEDFMRPNDLTTNRLAADLDVTPSRISEIIRGTRPITLDTALRLEIYFGMPAHIWIGMQAHYDEAVKRREILRDLQGRVKTFRAAA
jgi:addiction module HigA family antidote